MVQLFLNVKRQAMEKLWAINLFQLLMELAFREQEFSSNRKTKNGKHGLSFSLIFGSVTFYNIAYVTRKLNFV